MWIINLFFKNISDLIFPKSCFLCKSKNTNLCPRCLKDLSLCLYQKNNYTYSHFSYRDKNVRKLIKNIKYYHQKNLIAPLTSQFIDNISKFTEKENNILVPIPMTKIRKYLRGQNHSEEIAKEVGIKLNIPIAFNLLKRIKNTRRQVVAKTITGRLKNQTGSFGLENIDDYKNKNIILIDDVITTGATCEEARKIFLKSGFNNVKIITIAH